MSVGPGMYEGCYWIVRERVATVIVLLHCIELAILIQALSKYYYVIRS